MASFDDEFPPPNLQDYSGTAIPGYNSQANTECCPGLASSPKDSLTQCAWCFLCPGYVQYYVSLPEQYHTRGQDESEVDGPAAWSLPVTLWLSINLK